LVGAVDDQMKARRLSPARRLEHGGEPAGDGISRGGSGAMRTVDHLKTKKISAERLFILQNGLQAWPYKAMLKVIEDE
jgi:hypothetical protein